MLNSNIFVLVYRYSMGSKQAEAENILVTAGRYKNSQIDIPVFGVRSTYIEALTKANFFPILVGPGMSKDNIEHFYEMCAAILFTGGTDWNPKLYDQAPIPETQTPDDERDAIEQKLFQMALLDKKPILAICRGIQGLAIAVRNLSRVRTGKSVLIQHLPYITDQTHTSLYAELTKHTHRVGIVPGTLAHEIFPSGIIDLPSAHHQAINSEVLSDLPILVASGFSQPDKIVEMIEVNKDTNAFCLGIQGHPEVDERLYKPLMTRLYKEAQKYAKKTK